MRAPRRRRYTATLASLPPSAFLRLPFFLFFFFLPLSPSSPRFAASPLLHYHHHHHHHLPLSTTCSCYHLSSSSFSSFIPSRGYTPAHLLASWRWIFTRTMVGRPACAPSLRVRAGTCVYTRSGGTRAEAARRVARASARAISGPCCVRRRCASHQRGESVERKEQRKRSNV